LAARHRLPPADAVVASSYAFAHGFRSRDEAPRLCYSWGPLRFAWSMSDEYRRHWASSRASRLAFDGLTAWMRAADRRAAAGVDRFVVPLASVGERIRAAYRVEAEVIGPPVDTELFSPGSAPPGDPYLYCGRLIEPYKRTKALVEAFNGLDERLLIAGDGPARPELEALAGPNIEFLGQLDDRELVAAMRACRAAVFPSRDDFGLVPVEVMACARPVLAFAGGGAVETVAPGVTGELFSDHAAAAIADAVRGFDPGSYDPRAIREHAMRWDRGRFRERIRAAVDNLVSASRDGARI
jgi:glycosyltransferase involved in cell wall biosynthesis